MRLSTDMGLSDVQEYAARLKKAEKALEAKEKVSRPSAFSDPLSDVSPFPAPLCITHAPSVLFPPSLSSYIYSYCLSFCSGIPAHGLAADVVVVGAHDLLARTRLLLRPGKLAPTHVGMCAPAERVSCWVLVLQVVK